MTDRTCWNGPHPCIFVREHAFNPDPETGEERSFEFYCVHPKMIREAVKMTKKGKSPFGYVHRMGKRIEDVKLEQPWCPCWIIRRFN
jgi:hypothetical protein